MEPTFLTADWEGGYFPSADNTNEVNSSEWTEVLDCCPSQQWMRWVMNMPLFERPPWVIPSCVYTFAQPALIAYPPTQNKAGPYYRQQVISNAPNTHWNDFNEPLRRDLVHYNRNSIPLIPTGNLMDINMKYHVELLLEPDCALVTIQLKDQVHGRLLKLDMWVTDSEITTRMAVNHRRANHVENDDAFMEGDYRRRYWDME